MEMKKLSSAAPVTAASIAGKKARLDLILRVVTDTQEFANLEREWNRLSDSCPDTDIFSTWAWLYHWWRAFGEDHSLRLYVVRDTTGRLRGILPCYLRELCVFKLFRLYELRMVGTGDDVSPDYLDVVAAPRDRGAVTSLMIPHLLSESAVWDVLCMDDMPAESPFTRRLPREMPGHVFVRERNPVPIIELPPTWDHYLMTLDSRQRQAIESDRKRFHQQVEGRHFVWHNRSTLDGAVDRLIELHRAHQGGSSDDRFDRDAYWSFHRGLIRELLDRDQVRLHCLEVEREIIAMLYCYWWRQTVYYFEGCFDPRFDFLSPKSVLMGYAIEHAIGEGAVRFDMLKGDLEYKRGLAMQTRETVSLGAYRNSARGRIARFRRETLPALRRVVLSGSPGKAL